MLFKLIKLADICTFAELPRYITSPLFHALFNLLSVRSFEILCQVCTEFFSVFLVSVFYFYFFIYIDGVVLHTCYLN